MFTTSEKAIFCPGCIIKYPDLFNTHKERDKYRVFLDWYKVDFPSGAYIREAERQRKLAEMKAEEKLKKDEFLAIESAKPLQQQIQELRKKLYEANKILNDNYYNLSTRIAKVPVFPFYW